MRKFIPFISIGCAAVIILGVIGAGIAMLIHGAKPFLDKLSSRKSESSTTEKEQPGNPHFKPIPPEKTNLFSARDGFQTHLVNRFAKDKSKSTIDPGSTVRYGRNLLAAYHAPKPLGNKKYPAVVWAHSGTAGLNEKTWKALEPFRKADFVVMAPTFRGEQGNAGDVELFYGEVDDLLEAVEYVQRQAYVKQDQIYVIGEKGGGTLSLLAATTGNTEVRAFLALAPVTDMEEHVSQKLAQKDTPFDITIRDESRLRSPLRFARFIQRPTYSFNPAHTFQDLQSKKMLTAATTNEGISLFHTYSIPDATVEDMDKLIPLLVKKLRSDSNPNRPMKFTDEELAECFEK